MRIFDRVSDTMYGAAVSASHSAPGIFAAAALLAYIGQPMVPYLPDWTFGAALWSAACILTLMTASNQRKLHIVGSQALLGFAGTVALMVAFADASTELKANDKRCLAIQRDMLSAHPRISDGPGKFQALGCRPQGTDTRIFVPPTDRERAAGKALPHGGYPPPR